MKKSLVQAIFVPVALLIATPGAIYAQEFFRELGTSRSSGGFGPVYPSDYSYEDATPSGMAPLSPGQDLNEAQAAEEADRYNFAIGPVQFGLAVGVGIEYNDNITLSDDDQVSDFVFRPLLDIHGHWRLSELNTLRLSVGLSYAKYFNHSQYDSHSVLVTPNSELAFTFYIGQVKVTVRDRLSYQEDGYTDPTLSNLETPYRYWVNQIGFALDWAINDKLSLLGGYDHYNLWTIGDEFSLQDQAIDTVFLKPSYQIAPGVKIGLVSTYSFINFDSDERPDGNGMLLGPFVEWQVSEYTSLYLEGGYQALQFDQLNLSSSDADAVNNILYNDENENTYYVKFEINNKPSDIFDHRLSFSKTAEIGYSSNYYNLFHAEYDANWKVFEHAEIGPVVFYEYYTSAGQEGESAQRIGAGLGIRYHFSNSFTAGLDYRFIAKDSDLPNSSYRQNLAMLSFYYKF